MNISGVGPYSGSNQNDYFTSMLNKLKSQLKILEDAQSAFSSSQTALESRVIDLEVLTGQHTGTIGNLGTDLGTLTGRVDDAEFDIGQNTNNLETGYTRLQDAENNIIQLQTDVSAIDTVQIDTNATNIGTLQNNVITIKGDIDNVQTDITTLQGTDTNLQQQIDNAFVQIGNNATAHEGINTDIQTNVNAIQANADDITALQNTNSDATDLVNEWNTGEYSRFMTVLKANSLAYKQQSFEINQPTANSTYSFTQNTSTLLEDLIFDVRLRLRVAADGYNTGDILWTYFENGVHESPGGLGRGIAIHGNPTSDQTFSVSMPDSGALTAIHANGGTCETLLSNLDILIQIRSHLDWTPAVV